MIKKYHICFLTHADLDSRMLMQENKMHVSSPAHDGGRLSLLSLSAALEITEVLKLLHVLLPGSNKNILVVCQILKENMHAMRRVRLLMSMILTATSANASCYDCCSPGGSCEHAYKQGPGVCCGSGGSTQCCPSNSRCHSCNGREFRCYPSGDRPIPCPYHDQWESIDTMVLFAVGMFLLAMWWTCTSRSAQPYPIVTATPMTSVPHIPPLPSVAPLAAAHTQSGMGNMMTGFLGGMLVADMISDSPPGYRETCAWEESAGMAADL